MALLPNNTADSRASSTPSSASAVRHTVDGPSVRRRRSPHSRSELGVRRRVARNDDGDSKTTTDPTATAVERHDALPVPATMVSKVGDLDREQEIERRLAELGLTEYKRRHERSIAESLDSQIVSRDGLAAVVRRCRRRQRDAGREQSGNESGNERPVDEIRKLVHQKIFRNARGEKIAYEIRIFLGCFTKNVTFQTEGGVVSVRCATADDDPDSNVDGVGGSVKLTKDITVELPKSADWTRLSVTCSGGVVRIHAPIGDIPPEQHGAPPLKSWTATANAVDSAQREDRRLKPEDFTSVSLLYSLHKKLLATSESASLVGK